MDRFALARVVAVSVALGSVAMPARASEPAPAPAPTPTCSADTQCADHRECVAARCVATSAYLAELQRKGQRATVGGAAVLGFGAIALTAGTGSLIAGSLRHGDDGGSDGAVFLAGYTLLGVGGTALTIGIITLAVGQAKLNRRRRYETERGKLSLGLDGTLRF